MIPGGYYLKARKGKHSWIAHAAPCIREIWEYLLREANHADNGVCKRGQLVRSYQDIQDGLHWMVGFRKKTYSKWQCEWALKQLTKERMTTTTKTTRGVLITIVNYETYQNPANYESHDEHHNDATRTPQCRHTINKKEKKKKNEKKEEITESKRLFGEFVLLTDAQYAKLVERFGQQGTDERIADLNVGIGSKGYHYVSHYHTILSWENLHRKRAATTGTLPFDAAETEKRLKDKGLI